MKSRLTTIVPGCFSLLSHLTQNQLYKNHTHTQKKQLKSKKKEERQPNTGTKRFKEPSFRESSHFPRLCHNCTSIVVSLSGALYLCVSHPFVSHTSCDDTNLSRGDHDMWLLRFFRKRTKSLRRVIVWTLFDGRVETCPN